MSVLRWSVEVHTPPLPKNSHYFPNTNWYTDGDTGGTRNRTLHYYTFTLHSIQVCVTYSNPSSLFLAEAMFWTSVTCFPASGMVTVCCPWSLSPRSISHMWMHTVNPCLTDVNSIESPSSFSATLFSFGGETEGRDGEEGDRKCYQQ